MLSLREKKNIYIYKWPNKREELCCAVFEQPAVITGSYLFNIFFFLHWQFAAILYLSQLFWASLNFKHFVLLLSLQINIFTNKRGWASFDDDEYARDFKLLKYDPTERLRSMGRAEFWISTEAELDSVKEYACWMAEANNEQVNKYEQLGTPSKL